MPRRSETSCPRCIHPQKNDVQLVTWPVMCHHSDDCSIANRNWLRPITSVKPSLEGKSKGWTAMSRPALHRIAIHIDESQGFPGFTNSAPMVCFCADSYSNVSREPLHRTYLHLLQHLSGQDTLCITRPSILSTMIYSLSHSITIDWMTRMLGMTELDGANSLMFVKDGVTSYSLRHST